MGTSPTAEMIQYFEARTRRHIQLVRICLSAFPAETLLRKELDLRGNLHDLSKFGEDERLAYIWLTEWHRCRNHGIAFEYPVGMESIIGKAINHHVTTNRHHPEFHSSPSAMSKVDIIEMICDWTAMSLEKDGIRGSALKFANDMVGTKWMFDDTCREQIFKTIEILDEAVKQKSIALQIMNELATS
jgi:hypothetical protein